ncbi:hypothetical protein [Polaribacter tangerinus]|uniref:hypothetical protein n=1 Tax=Polaribacter tangerinus TaxID=1920034 RepID=UPI001180A0D2|nr:hypothetical protein [Polaribacter tangerinus]
MKSILKITLLLTSIILFNCTTNESSEESVICKDVGLDCNKTPYSYKACADASGNAWWELNGEKFDDVLEATAAYENYCD